MIYFFTAKYVDNTLNKIPKIKIIKKIIPIVFKSSIFKEFLMYLEENNIISEREAGHILDLPDLKSQKIATVVLSYRKNESKRFNVA